MNHLKKIFSISIILALVILVSCNNKKAKSNEVVINTGGEVQSIDPHINTATDGSVYIQHMFEGLTRKDKTDKISGGMAESWTISDDGLVYTFNIRKDAKWSDGKPLTAEDFVYSYKRVVNPTNAIRYSTLLEPIKNAKDITAGKISIDSLGIKAIDENTLEITLEAPIPYFLEFIATTGVYMPVRRDIIEQYKDTWVLQPESYIVNGPYRMTSRKQDENIVMEINPEYWAKDELVAQKITVLMLDSVAALAAVKEGSLHFSTKVSSEDIPKLSEEGLIQINQALGTAFWEINVTNKKFSDPRVRKALSLAIDRNYLIDNITKAKQKPATALVPPLVKGVNKYFREEGEDYIPSKPEDYAKNIEEAKKLMAEAGYPDGKGYPVIEVLVTSGVRQLEAEAIQQMWKENLNVDLKVVTREWAAILQSFRDLSYEMISSGWTGDYNDPTTMLNLYLSYAPNNPGYTNKEYDALLEMSKYTVDIKERMDMLHKAEAILINDMPIIPTYYRAAPIMISKQLKDYRLDQLGKYRFHYSHID